MPAHLAVGQAPSVPLTDEKRLRSAKVLVAASCAIFAVIALETLHGKAAGIAVLALLVLALNWSNKSISATKKLGFVLIALTIVTAVNLSETGNRSVIETPQNGSGQDAAAKQNLAEQQAAQEVEDNFKRMTPREHLSAVRKDFTEGASESQLEDGNKNIDALRGNPLEKQGEALRARYYAQAQRQAETDLENARIGYAQKLQNSLLDNDMDADVNAIGPHHTILRLKYVLATKLFVYKFSKEVLPEYIADMRQLKFKKLIISNGYDEQWTWNL